jgi:hypothetical protein
VILRKLFSLIALLVLAALASGCMVRAVYPWLRTEDITFEENLLGGWIGKSENKEVAMTFVRTEKNSYEVQYSDGEKHGVFLGKLAKFGGDYYLDFKPKDEVPGLEGLLFAWGEDDNELILTSKTEDLQRFLVALGHDSTYFGPPIKLARRK